MHGRIEQDGGIDGFVTQILPDVGAEHTVHRHVIISRVPRFLEGGPHISRLPHKRSGRRDAKLRTAQHAGAGGGIHIIHGEIGAAAGITGMQCAAG